MGDSVVLSQGTPCYAPGISDMYTNVHMGSRGDQSVLRPSCGPNCSNWCDGIDDSCTITAILCFHFACIACGPNFASYYNPTTIRTTSAVPRLQSMGFLPFCCCSTTTITSALPRMALPTVQQWVATGFVADPICATACLTGPKLMTLFLPTPISRSV